MPSSGESASQHVIQPPILVGALDADEVVGFFDYADGGLVSRRIQADSAQLLFGEVETPVAETDGLLDVNERLRQRQRVLGGVSAGGR